MANQTIKQTTQILEAGGVGILPTDTLYGLVGQALDRKAVKRIYELKARKEKNPFIILISSLDDLPKLNIKLDRKIKNFLKTIWPGPVSVVLDCPNKRLNYLHRETKTLAIRLPKSKFLQNLIKQTGPLVAPSANPLGSPPAETIAEAKKYFPNLDFIVSVGRKLAGQPSTLIKIKNGKIETLRQGRIKIKQKEI
ncbi:MAG: L-threonylcarbamoyladenylate synthase [Candidatus Paceibacterota bacterium]|jgi:L-threonylcarbamoyladenylate synthase